MDLKETPNPPLKRGDPFPVKMSYDPDVTSLTSDYSARFRGLDEFRSTPIDESPFIQTKGIWLYWANDLRFVQIPKSAHFIEAAYITRKRNIKHIKDKACPK